MALSTFNETVNLILDGSVTVDAQTVVSLLDAAKESYYNSEDSFEFPVVTEDGVSGVTATASPDDTISDAQFDALELVLKGIDPNNIYFTSVGASVRGGKVPLPFRMGSLDQVHEGQAAKWVESESLKTESFILSDKLDGTSVALVYDRKGKFKAAFSRGNGIMGADITRHVKQLAGVPETIDSDGEGLMLRAEAIIPLDAWPTVKAQTEQATGRSYKNPRNYVAGKMNASDTDPIFAANAHIVVTSIENREVGKANSLELARSLGFKVTYYEVVDSTFINDGDLSAHLEERRDYSGKGSNYEIDGIVADVDNIETRKRLTSQSTSSGLNPAFARKFKIASADNAATTRVVAVHWRASKAGYLKPRVEIEPVELSGVTITFASGSNAKFIIDNKVGPGAVVEMTRAGDVIPYITKVVTGTSPSLPDETVFGAYSLSKTGVDLVLDDAGASEEVRLNRMIDVFKTLEIDFLRKGTVEKLIAAGYDDEIKVIKATQAQLQNAIGDSAGEKVFASLRTKLADVKLATLADASQTIGRGVGTRKLQRIIDQYGSLDVTYEQIIAVEGFEETTAKLVASNLPKFNQYLADLAGYFTLAAKKEVDPDAKFVGVNVVFTGVRDKELQAHIEANGGVIQSAVNAQTTYLICKDPSDNSSKLVKARKLLAADKIIDLATAQGVFK